MLFWLCSVRVLNDLNKPMFTEWKIIVHGKIGERNNEIMTVQVEGRSKREGRLGNEQETDVQHSRGLTPLACKYR